MCSFNTWVHKATNDKPNCGSIQQKHPRHNPRHGAGKLGQRRLRYQQHTSALIPAGLGAGDSFQIAFVTSATTTRNDGTGSDTYTVGHWNTFVNTVADGSSNADVKAINWFAAVCTVDVDARDNAAVSQDVYRIDGVMVDTAVSFWFDKVGKNADGTGGIQHAISVDENGVARSVAV